MEHPILLCGPMVQATLQDRKTQTRRLPTRQHCAYVPTWLWKRLEFDPAKVPEGATPLTLDDGYFHVPCRPHPEESQTPAYWTRERVYPKWDVGDRLWVKETWQKIERPNSPTGVIYAATHIGDPPCEGWRPAIFMPRWACRIILEVTAVRAQQLQDIGRDGRHARDVLAEGILEEAIDREREWFHPDDAPALAFSRLWDSLNGKKSLWASNPFVFAISFRRLTPEPQKENP